MRSEASVFVYGWWRTEEAGGERAVVDAKTQPTQESPSQFTAAIEDDQRQKDSLVILRLMKKITRQPPKMWGPSIVGFGRYHYRYASGREGDWFLTGFSPRKQALTLYIMSGFAGYDVLLKKLGSFKTGKSCLYIKRLEDVDMHVLTELITRSVRHGAQMGAVVALKNDDTLKRE